jgi:hypothetical protein
MQSSITTKESKMLKPIYGEKARDRHALRNAKRAFFARGEAVKVYAPGTTMLVAAYRMVRDAKARRDKRVEIDLLAG